MPILSLYATFLQWNCERAFCQCQVGNLRLKSGLKSLLMGVNMILLKMKVDSERELFKVPWLVSNH